ncbi:MAG: hypothetical protein ACK5TA_03020, partial [bacterium]
MSFFIGATRLLLGAFGMTHGHGRTCSALPSAIVPPKVGFLHQNTAVTSWRTTGIPAINLRPEFYPTHMKIERIETHVCHARMRNWVFVKVITDQPGLYGWGEATLEWHTR